MSSPPARGNGGEEKIRYSFVPEVAVKPAELKDAPALLDIQRQAFGALLEKYQDSNTNPAMESLETLTRKLQQKDYWFILEGGHVVGVAGIRHWESTCRISPIGLLPECQGRGIGDKAIELLEAQYPEAKRWELDTILQEPGLCRFYESLGYHPTGEVHLIKQGMCTVDYEKIR